MGDDASFVLGSINIDGSDRSRERSECDSNLLGICLINEASSCPRVDKGSGVDVLLVLTRTQKFNRDGKRSIVLLGYKYRVNIERRRD